MDNNLTPENKIITEFIYQKPEIVVKHLESAGYKIPGVVTLPKIIEKAFKAIYIDNNARFITLMDTSINSPEFNNYVMAIAAIVVSIAGMISSANQAKKALKVQQQIALAQLTANKDLAETQIRTEAETERTKILLNTLYQYRTDLQSQSTKRLRDVWIYSGILAAGISLIYGTFVLIKNPEA